MIHDKPKHRQLETIEKPQTDASRSVVQQDITAVANKRGRIHFTNKYFEYVSCERDRLSGQ